MGAVLRNDFDRASRHLGAQPEVERVEPGARRRESRYTVVGDPVAHPEIDGGQVGARGG